MSASQSIWPVANLEEYFKSRRDRIVHQARNQLVLSRCHQLHECIALSAKPIPLPSSSSSCLSSRWFSCVAHIGSAFSHVHHRGLDKLVHRMCVPEALHRHRAVQAVSLRMDPLNLVNHRHFPLTEQPGIHYSSAAGWQCASVGASFVSGTHAGRGDLHGFPGFPHNHVSCLQSGTSKGHAV